MNGPFLFDQRCRERMCAACQVTLERLNVPDSAVDLFGKALLECAKQAGEDTDGADWWHFTNPTVDEVAVKAVTYLRKDEDDLVDERTFLRDDNTKLRALLDQERKDYFALQKCHADGVQDLENKNEALCEAARGILADALYLNHTRTIDGERVANVRESFLQALADALPSNKRDIPGDALSILKEFYSRGLLLLPYYGEGKELADKLRALLAEEDSKL